MQRDQIRDCYSSGNDCWLPSGCSRDAGKMAVVSLRHSGVSLQKCCANQHVGEFRSVGVTRCALRAVASLRRSPLYLGGGGPVCPYCRAVPPTRAETIEELGVSDCLSNGRRFSGVDSERFARGCSFPVKTCGSGGSHRLSVRTPAGVRHQPGTLFRNLTV